MKKISIYKYLYILHLMSKNYLPKVPTIFNFELWINFFFLLYKDFFSDINIHFLHYYFYTYLLNNKIIKNIQPHNLIFFIYLIKLRV